MMPRIPLRFIRATLAVEYQYSLWELFFVFANDNKELGRALRAVTLGTEPDSGIRRAEVAVDGVHECKPDDARSPG